MSFNIYTWGNNTYKQCGIENPDIISQPTLVNSITYKKVATGYYHNLAIDSNNNLCSWGRNNYYQLGDNSNMDNHNINIIDDSKIWTDISAGRYHSVAITNNNELYYWGNINNKIIKTPELLDTDVIKVDCGNLFISYIKSNNDLYIIGTINYTQFKLKINIFKQTRDGRTGPLKLFKQNEPFQILSAVDNFYCGYNHIIAIESNNKYIMGYHPLIEIDFIDNITNLSRKFSILSTFFELIPEYINFIPQNINKITSNGQHSLLIDSNNNLYGLGNNFHKELGVPNNIRIINKFEFINQNNINDISCGSNHSLILKNNILHACGLNNYKQCKNSNDYIINQFVSIDSENTYNGICSGLEHNIAIK